LISGGGGGNGIGFVSATGGGGGGGVLFTTFCTGGGGWRGSSRGAGGGVGSISSTGRTTGFIRAKSRPVHDWLDNTPAMPKWISADNPSAMLHEESESRDSTHTPPRFNDIGKVRALLLPGDRVRRLGNHEG